MKQFYLLILFLLFAPAFAGAQAISINTDASNPDPSAILDVKSSVKGMLVPRMTTGQRTAIAAPAAGLLVYDTDTDSFWYFDNGIWNQVVSIAVPPPIATGVNNTGIPIPDNNPTGITSIINLTQGGVIDASTQINVCIDITHTADADLDISLIAPDGTTIDLSSDNGSINDNYTNTCFTTALAPGITTNNNLAPFTGYWTPEQPFSNFINKSIPGNWTLKVVDDRNTSVGQLNWWSIEFPSVSVAPALLSDKDGDTKVQVEKNPDEDIIRFELSGTEGMVLRKNATGSPRLELPNALNNTFLGTNAGSANTTGYSNTANGVQALRSNTTGYENTANGSQALRDNTTGYQNTASGSGALVSNTTGNYNTANGSQALYSNTTGNDNTANGSQALYSNTTGNLNTANGREALAFNTTGNNNTASGSGALYSNTTGSNNTANGFLALAFNTTGYENTANGSQALLDNTTGYQNTANGTGALAYNTTGNYNTANGAYALYYNTTGSNNTANGAEALSSNTTGNFNTASGLRALISNTTGNNNTANGHETLRSNTTGSNNTVLGYYADVLFDNLTNATAIGYNAKVGASNSLVLGGTGADAVSVGVGTLFPNASALLDLTSTDKGMLVPRMTTAERTAIAMPATSLLVYDTDTNAFWFYNGTDWAKIPVSYTAGSGISIVGTTISNTGDAIAADDITNGTAAGGDLTGTYPNPTVAANAIGSAEITDASIAVADLNFGAAVAAQVLTATSATTAAWLAPAVQKILADADNDTKVQVEKNADEDIIRFDLAGTESMVLRKNTGGVPRLELPGLQGNTYVGTNAGLSNTSGNDNAALGNGALASNTTGAQNTANGYYALFSNTTGSQNAAFGNAALGGNNAGSGNTALGMQALTGNTTGNENTASGSYALFSNSTGHSNTGLGSQALFVNSTGQGNTAAGYSALFSNTTGFSNVALGRDALYSNTDRSNLVAVGDSALYNNGVGATGSQATNNTAIGSKALFSNTTGFDNTANGVNALQNNTTGFGNTANGRSALGSNTTGSNNTAIGSSAASGATAHNNCTFVGASIAITTNRTNVSVLGYSIANAQCTADNQVLLGNTGIGQIRAQVAGITAYSDGRFKTNVQQDVPGLDFISKLKPVTYNQNPELLHRIWGTPDSVLAQIDHTDIKGKRFIGFVAQEVEQAARACNFEFPGIDAPSQSNEVYTLRYVDFIMPLVKGMQEQQEVIEAQTGKMEKLEAENAAMKAENSAMKAQLDAQADQLKQITAALQTAGIGVGN